MRVVFNLLGEGICQPGKAAGVHPNAEIAALHIRCRDVIDIRVAFDLLASWAGSRGRFRGLSIIATASFRPSLA
jgi:hypothetical protein